MAEEYDPQVMQELMSNLDALNASLGPLATRMGQMSGALDAQGNAINKEGEAIKASIKFREGESKASQDVRTANEQLRQASQHLKQSFNLATTAATSFADALLAGEGKFSAYNKAIDGAGEAAWQLGKAFGPLGMAIGGAVKAVSKVAQVFTEQADAQNEFVTQMYRMGALSGQSSDKLTDLAREAGYTAEDLGKLTPIITKNSKALASLGGTTGEGTTKLMGMFKAANDAERSFYRIGYSLEELQEVQGAYLDLQRGAGINLQAQNMTQEQLNQRSLDYAKNLRAISDLTGKSVEELQREQAQAQLTYENRASNLANSIKANNLDNKAKEAAAAGNEQLAAQYRKQAQEVRNGMEVQKNAIDAFSQEFGGEMGDQIARVMRTGAFNDATKDLANLGVNAAELKQRFDALATIENADERAAAQRELTNEMIVNMRQLGQTRATQLAVTAQHDAAAAKSAGLMEGTMHSLERGSLNAEEEMARREAVQKGIDKKMEEGGDKQRDIAAALIDNERSLRTAADKALDALNPLTNGFDKATLAVEALALAAGIAAATMMMGGLGGGPGKATKMIKSAGSKVATAAKNVGSKVASSKAGQTVAKAGKTVASKATSVSAVLNNNPAVKALGRLAGPLAAVTEVAGGVMSAMEGRERAEKNLAEGRITKEEAGRRKTQETAEGAGQAVGGAGGALAGAAAGAAIGSVVPVIGTAIGGIIGGIAGAWLGSKGGEEIGGAIGEAMTISPEMEEQNERNRELVQELGIYNENWLGASEVNMEKLREGIDAGTVTNDMINAMIQDNDLTDAQLEELTALQAEQQEKLNENLTRQKEAAEGIMDASRESANYTKEQAEKIATHAIELRRLEKEMADATDVEQKRLIQEQINATKADLEASKKFEETVEGPFGTAVSAIGNMLGSIGSGIAGFFGFGGDKPATASPTGGGAGGASGGTDYMAMAGGGAAAGASNTGGGGAGGASGGPMAEIDPDSSPEDRLQQDPSKQRLISAKPDNVKVGPKADLTGVDNQLLAKFFTAAQDFGQDVTVNSAYRGDQYQAQLWVRGRILNEPGIYTPARPKNTTKINYKGKDYTVEGSGRGSKHREGDALDISGNRGAFDPFLARYGLVRPYKQKDPPHVEMMKAKDGGLAQGPQSGYLAELHSNEMIVPLQKDSILAKLGQLPESAMNIEALTSGLTGISSRTETTNLPDPMLNIEALTSMFSQHIPDPTMNLRQLGAISSEVSPESVGINLEALTSGLSDMSNTMTASMQDVSGIGTASITSLMEKMGKSNLAPDEALPADLPTVEGDMYAMLSSKLDTMIERLGGDDKEKMVLVMEKYLSQMVSKLDDGNDIQGKILQYGKV